MKQIIKKIDFLKVAQWLAMSIMLLVPASSALAVTVGTNYCDPTYQNCTGTSVAAFIKTVIGWLLGIAFGVAILFLIIGGFWYVTSAGNEETAEKGKTTVINAIIGIVVIVLSYVIVNVVAGLVGTNNSTTTG